LDGVKSQVVKNPARYLPGGTSAMTYRPEESVRVEKPRLQVQRRPARLRLAL